MGLALIITRPGAPGQQWTAAARARGVDALWLPAFDFGPAPDPLAARAALARLADYDLAIFVSPQAAAAAAALLDTPWPAGTRIGAMGAGTRRAVLQMVAGAQAAQMLAPEQDDGGSEALWRELAPRLGAFARVLILRASHGREWLAARLRERGSQVVELAVYTRRPAPLTEEARQWLRARRAAARQPALLVTSSEAVPALAAQLAPVDLQWLRGGVALATHARIARRLRAAGFTQVREVAAEIDAVLTGLAQ